jgi:DNA-binding transcriptional LysR family regulator
MIMAEPDEASERMRAGEIDLALVYDSERIPGMLDDDLELTHLLDDPYEVVMPETHPLASRRRLRLADFSDEPWIVSSGQAGCRPIYERACADAGFEPRFAFEADETMAAQALVAAGVGITLLPKLALNPLHPALVSRPLGQDAPVRRIWAAHLGEGFVSPATEAMRQILCDTAGEFLSEAKLAVA